MAGTGTTIQIGAANVKYLERRGARSHRGGGEFSRSAVLGRLFETIRRYQAATDPRETRAMPEAMHQLVLRLLPQPWTLNTFEIKHLAAKLESAAGFAAAVTAAGVDPAALLAFVASLDMAEKLTLVDQSVQAQAPAAAAASPEEP